MKVLHDMEPGDAIFHSRYCFHKGEQFDEGHIPEEVFPRVVAFWAHTGFYGSVAAVAALAAETNPRTNRGNLLRNLCGAIGA